LFEGFRTDMVWDAGEPQPSAHHLLELGAAKFFVCIIKSEAHCSAGRALRMTCLSNGK